MAYDSEVRLYGFIRDKLKELGWDSRSPRNGGQVYTQNEYASNPQLKNALGLLRPENIVKLENQEYWTIEAKRSIDLLDVAVKEAEEYAAKINEVPELNCQIITGIAGSPDETYHIETRCLVKGIWKPLKINNRLSTGFISPEQIAAVLAVKTGELNEYNIDDNLFISKTQGINEILHRGAINKRDRASVMACVLLALAEDERLSLTNNASTLINDINTRAEAMLDKYNKKQFFEQIRIKLPPSRVNHEKYRKALVNAIDQLRDLNIASAIDSGMDVLGQFYEQFLKYANDAKELGIVFTPRHITEWAAQILDIKYDDIVFDPACGTGGFLVAALDKVKRDKANEKNFKAGNYHGIESDPVIATLAIVNMIFRGDGSSNILEGDSLTQNIDIRVDKVLMNPPFAHETEFEWKFVDVALGLMKENGLLLAVLPASTMISSNSKRQEISWRKELLKRHALRAVIKLPDALFYPQVDKGAYAVIIESHCPHDLANDKIVWGIMQDGIKRTKTQRIISEGNMNDIAVAIGNYLATRTEPEPIAQEVDCSLLNIEGDDFSPENHIANYEVDKGVFDLAFIQNNLIDGKTLMKRPKQNNLQVLDCVRFQLVDFFESIGTGKSGRGVNLPEGNLPLISTSEYNNGISELVDKNSVNEVYKQGAITISANGKSCCAFYHDYDFAANPDVFVLHLKPEYKNHKNFPLFLCASINSEKWRFSYYRKSGLNRLKDLKITLPITR